MEISNFITSPKIGHTSLVINYFITSIYFLLTHESSGMDEIAPKRPRIEETDFRIALKNERNCIENKAVKYMKENSKLTEDDVRTELRKYIFPEVVEMQMKFVKDWVVLLNEEKSELPDWSQEYKIANPKLYSRLRYAEALDKEHYTIDEAKEIYSNLFPRLEKTSYSGNFLEDMLDTFQNNKVFKSVSIQDFFALEYYVHDGYKSIGGTSLEAKIMREAFYRLSIRQSDDPLEQTKDLILYRGGSKHPQVAEELFGPEKTEYEFTRFTSTSKDKSVAEEFELFKTRIKNKKQNFMLYEMRFSKPFVRARLESIIQNEIQSYEKETVLLPGSKFRIGNVTRYEEKENQFMFVELFFHDYMSKEQWHKKIMDELENLEKNGAAPYRHDLPSES